MTNSCFNLLDRRQRNTLGASSDLYRNKSMNGCCKAHCDPERSPLLSLSHTIFKCNWRSDFYLLCDQSICLSPLNEFTQSRKAGVLVLLDSVAANVHHLGFKPEVWDFLSHLLSTKCNTISIIYLRYVMQISGDEPKKADSQAGERFKGFESVLVVS